MSTPDQLETNTQDSPIKIILVVIGISLFFCLAMAGLFFLARELIFRNILNTVRRTPTPVSLVEVNSDSPLGEFYFGNGDADGFCHINDKVDEFSQEDLLRDADISFSIPYASEHLGKYLEWSVYDTDGKEVDIGEPRYALDSESENCFEGGIDIGPRTKPGKYILEVKFEKELAYREIFTITYSDLTKIPRPKREPFGKFTFGRTIYSDERFCRTNDQVATYRIKILKDDPWFYFVSPYQLSDLDKKFYWSVLNENGRIVYSQKERVIDDDIDLCLWQGFSMGNAQPGVYILLIEDENFNELYKTTFELKE